MKRSPEYKKQIRRIRQALRRQQAKGYNVQFNDLVNSRTSLSKLQSITPEYIRNTAEKKQRQKEIRRIKQAIRRQIKKGYIIEFTDIVQPDLSVKELKQITPTTIRQNATRFDVDTGEIFYNDSGVYTIGMQTDFIISSFKQNVSRYFPSRRDPIQDVVNYINGWLDLKIQDYGATVVANILTESRNMGLWISPEEFYKMGNTFNFIYTFDSLFDDFDSGIFNGEIWETEEL